MESLSELKSELKAPIKSFRLFVIERAMKFDASNELLAILQDCLKSEEDAECQMLLQHAIQNTNQNLTKTPVNEVALDDIANLFAGATPEKQLTLIGAIKVSQMNFE